MNLPPYQTFPVISGNRVMLRPILPSDVKDIIEISFYDAKPAETAEQAAAMQEKINNDYIAGNSLHWGIAEIVTNKIIGTCGYYRGFDKAAGELGCVLLSSYQGKGYMTEAMKLAIEFGLNVMGLERIWAVTTKQNEKAVQLLERLGFTKKKDLIDHEVEYDLQCQKVGTS